MMLGNVAPAPLSFTCAAAGAMSASEAASVRSRVCFMTLASWSGLERELSLEQGLGTSRAVGSVESSVLKTQVVPVGEQAQIRTQLIRDASDDACLVIAGGTCVGVVQVDAGDDGDLG